VAPINLALEQLCKFETIIGLFVAE